MNSSFVLEDLNHDELEKHLSFILINLYKIYKGIIILEDPIDKYLLKNIISIHEKIEIYNEIHTHESISLIKSFKLNKLLDLTYNERIIADSIGSLHFKQIIRSNIEQKYYQNADSFKRNNINNIELLSKIKLGERIILKANHIDDIDKYSNDKFIEKFKIYKNKIIKND